jgi:hypothetical protein
VETSKPKTHCYILFFVIGPHQLKNYNWGKQGAEVEESQKCDTFYWTFLFALAALFCCRRSKMSISTHH